MSVRSLVTAAMFVAVTAVLAQVSIPLPFSPVPITGQTFSVFLASGVLGGRLAAISMVAYVFLGIAGLPIFSRAMAGPGVLLGPTGGYLIGFIIGAYAAGATLERRRNVRHGDILLAMCICLAVIHVLGTVQIALLMRLSLPSAFTVGSLPYLPLDALKAAIAATVAVPLRRALRQMI